MKWSAVDMPHLRDQTLIWVTRYGNRLYTKYIADGRQEVYPDLPPEKAGEVMAKEESWRLVNGELFHVTESMTDLVKVASQSLPEFTLLPSDLPSPSGFVYYSEPIYVVGYDEGPSPIVALSWGTWRDSPWSDGGVWVTTYADSDAVIAAQRSSLAQQELAIFRASQPPLLLDNEIQIPFSMEPIGRDNREGRLNGIAQTLRATWLLMGQPVASVQDVEFDRATRKRYQRENRSLPQVRVIGLRRSASGTYESKGDREYHHRWVVRGHWRNQWYSSINAHRPVWVSPHLKGPEGAPLIGGERVYSLRK